jgi:DNA-binding CsgD family transcriptional regulator
MDTVVRSASGAPFVARAQQLARFERALARARAGEPGALLLSGDAGVGKTRLLTRMAEIAQQDGALVVTGHCIDLGDVGLPYLPFTDALGQLRTATDTVERAIAARPALGRLLDGGLADGREGAESQAARLQLFDGIAAVLGAIGTAERPLLVMLEDLHWADPSSRDVLRFLLARLRSEHLLVVATYRTDDLHRQHPLRPVLAELLRHPKVDHLELPAFTHDELAEFAEAVTGRTLREATLDSVFTRSEGNAYFAQEILEAGPDAAVLPGSLADVLHGRLERLDPCVQALARIASVSGRRVSEPLLWAVAAHDPCFPDAAAFDRALREAVTHHVLAAEDSRWIAFRHALLAEAVYADLLPGELAGLHAAYLRELLADPSLGSQAEVAHHAFRSHDLPAALAASHAAAREAAEVLAPAEELRHLETVLQLWDAVPTAASLVGRDRTDVTMAAASAASRAGQPSRAAALATAALAQADPATAARITPAAVSQLIDNDQAGEALQAADRALAVLEVGPPSAERARVYAAHARAALNMDRDEDARRTAEKAITESRLLGIADAEADALTTLAVLNVDDADRAAALLAGAVDTARRTGDLLGELRSVHNLGANRYYAGKLSEAAAVLDSGIERARAAGVLWTGYGVGMLIFRQLIRYVSGDLAPEPPSADWVPESATWILSVVDLYGAVARGDTDAVERGRAAQADWQRDPMAALISGGCTIDALTWSGDHQPAVELTMRVIEYLDAAWNDYFLGGIWLSALGITALADRAEQTRLTGGDPRADIAVGATLLERAVETARRGRPRGGRLGPEGRAWLARAHAEYGRLVGNDEPARWVAVVEEFGYGYRYEIARARWRLAASLAATGDHSAARSEALTALAEAVEMGALPLADAVRDLGRRARLDLPGSRQPVAVLTDREEAVLALVAQGLTNRQVGERLFISSKTVSVHMSNVLAKLGVSGRAEAVAVAHRRGLLAREPTG